MFMVFLHRLGRSRRRQDLTLTSEARLSAERDRIEEQIGSLVNTRDRLTKIITTATRAKDVGHRCPGWVGPPPPEA